MPGGYPPGLPPVHSNSWMSSRVSPNMSDLVPADGNCSYGIHWVWVSMGQCVMDARGGFALFCGFVCLVIWIAVGIPQIIENFRTGIPDKALSFGFLSLWTFGDVCNLIGCFLTHQLIMQIVVTGYCIVSDLVLVFQFIYYKLRHQAILRQMATILKEGQVSPVRSASPTSSDDLEQTDRPEEHRRLPVSFIGVTGLTLAALTITSIGSLFDINIPQQQITGKIPYQSRRLLEWKEYELSDTRILDSDPLDGVVTKVGYTLGWISTCLYLFSRLPQLFRNWKRKSTVGLSLFMFYMTVTGNLSYGAQIFLSSTERNYLIRAVPWIIGSFGVVLLDMFILFQFCLYRSRQRQDDSHGNVNHDQTNLLDSNDNQTEVV
ncbi:unnamed protein product [Heterobilharzia americana]|nr:unnamed protein product [Heterobilharzia americana]